MDKSYKETSGSLHKPFVAEDAHEELSFVLGIEDAEGQVNQLSFVDKQHKGILADRSAFYLVPLQGHSFPGIDLHDDLLTADLV